jgi:SPW repeat-containing protein
MVKDSVMSGRATSTAARWQDWASFALGLWLALSPWIVGYTEHESATGNAVFLGLALALGCHFEVAFDECGPEWINLAAGLWLVVAPFVLGFSEAYVATANSIAVGSLVAVLAASALSLDKEVLKLLHKRA